MHLPTNILLTVAFYHTPAQAKPQTLAKCPEMGMGGEYALDKDNDLAYA